MTDQERISTKPPPPRRSKLVPRRQSGHVDWTRIALGALGVGSTVLGAVFFATPAGVALVGSGTALVTYAVARKPE